MRRDFSEGGRARPRQRRILQDLNRSLVMDAPLVDPVPENFVDPKGVEQWTFNLHGKPVDRIIIYLRSDVGCEFGVKTGGCTSCRHWRLGTAGQQVDLPDMYVHQYRNAVKQHGYFPVFCIYNEGNMLNHRELPHDQLLAIVRDLADNDVSRLVLESRIEHMDDRILHELRQAAGRMEIEIGIGLESSNDFIRNELFLKSTTLGSYEKAIETLQRFNIRSLAYVLLKPAFLNEAQAIADAIRTICYAFDTGTDAVSIEPIGVEPHTVTALLEAAGHFEPAWLWSVIKVAKETHRFGEVRLGGFQFEPLPEKLPKNCDACTPGVLEAINRYNLTNDIAILDRLTCGFCANRWEREIAAQDQHIDEGRMANALRRFVDGQLVCAS